MTTAHHRLTVDNKAGQPILKPFPYAIPCLYFDFNKSWFNKKTESKRWMTTAERVTKWILEFDVTAPNRSENCVGSVFDPEDR